MFIPTVREFRKLISHSKSGIYRIPRHPLTTPYLSANRESLGIIDFDSRDKSHPLNLDAVCDLYARTLPRQTIEQAGLAGNLLIMFTGKFKRVECVCGFDEDRLETLNPSSAIWEVDCKICFDIGRVASNKEVSDGDAITFWRNFNAIDLLNIDLSQRISGIDTLPEPNDDDEDFVMRAVEDYWEDDEFDDEG